MKILRILLLLTVLLLAVSSVQATKVVLLNFDGNAAFPSITFQTATTGLAPFTGSAFGLSASDANTVKANIVTLVEQDYAPYDITFTTDKNAPHDYEWGIDDTAYVFTDQAPWVDVNPYVACPSGHTCSNNRLFGKNGNNPGATDKNGNSIYQPLYARTWAGSLALGPGTASPSDGSLYGAGVGEISQALGNSAAHEIAHFFGVGHPADSSSHTDLMFTEMEKYEATHNKIFLPWAQTILMTALGPKPSPSCGDGTCNGAETCGSCPGDCGVCTSPYATLTANPAGVCVQPGSEVTYTWTYGGDPDGWNYVEFNWDPNAMDLVDHDTRCANIFADRVVCDQAGGFGGQPVSRFVTLKMKGSVTPGTSFDIFGWAETNVGPWKSGKTTVTTEICSATSPYATITADPAGVCVLPGSEVTYTLNCGGDPTGWSWLEIDWDKNSMSLVDHDTHCFGGYEDTEGFVCPLQGIVGSGDVSRFVTLKIEASVSPGSSLDIDGGCSPIQGGPSFDTSVSTTICSGSYPSPEFPSAVLPITMIIGFLGAVLLIQRTRDN